MKNKLITYSLLALLTSGYQTCAMEIVEQTSPKSKPSSLVTTPNNSHPNSPRTHNNSPKTPRELPKLILSNSSNNSSSDSEEKKPEINAFYIHSNDSYINLNELANPSINLTEDGETVPFLALNDQGLHGFNDHFSGFLTIINKRIFFNITHQNTGSQKHELNETAQSQLPITLTDEQCAALKNILQLSNDTPILAKDNNGGCYTIETKDLMNMLGIEVEKKGTSSLLQDSADETFNEMIQERDKRLDQQKEALKNENGNNIVEDKNKKEEALKQTTTTATSTKSPEKDPNINPNKRRNTIIGGGIVFMTIIALLYKYNQLPNIAELLNNIKSRVTYFNFPK